MAPLSVENLRQNASGPVPMPATGGWRHIDTGPDATSPGGNRPGRLPRPVRAATAYAAIGLVSFSAATVMRAAIGAADCSASLKAASPSLALSAIAFSIAALA